MDTTKVTRVEIIDHTLDAIEKKEHGRVWVKISDDLLVNLSLQDNKRTLKIFLDTEASCSEK